MSVFHVEKRLTYTVLSAMVLDAIPAMNIGTNIQRGDTTALRYMYVVCFYMYFIYMYILAFHITIVTYVGGSSKIQTLSHDSSSIEIEVYNNGKTHRLLKLLFFVYKCTGILLTSIYITQRVLATPTLKIGTRFYEYH